MDGSGQFLSVECVGASDPAISAELEDAIPLVDDRALSRAGGEVAENEDGGPRATTVLHLCSRGTEGCKARYGQLAVQHVEMVRKVRMENVQADWVHKGFRPSKKASSSSRKKEEEDGLVPAWAIRKDEDQKDRGRRRHRSSRSLGRRRR
jgi:hypothetical protein